MQQLKMLSVFLTGCILAIACICGLVFLSALVAKLASAWANIPLIAIIAYGIYSFHTTDVSDLTE